VGKLIDLTGLKFNHLTAMKYLGKSIWLCKCDCGSDKEVFVRGADLKNNHTKSCGCQKIHNEDIYDCLKEDK